MLSGVPGRPRRFRSIKRSPVGKAAPRSAQDNRTNNQAKQDEHYSGHKKTHTDKNLIIANRQTKRIGFLSRTSAGKVPDKKMADPERIVYPRGARLRKDPAFQAYELRGVETYQPKKTKAGRVNRFVT